MVQQTPESPRIFILWGGKRPDLLLISERARLPLAERLRSADGVTFGEAFTFLSGSTSTVRGQGLPWPNPRRVAALAVAQWWAAEQRVARPRWRSAATTISEMLNPT